MNAQMGNAVVVVGAVLEKMVEVMLVVLLAKVVARVTRPILSSPGLCSSIPSTHCT